MEGLAFGGPRQRLSPPLRQARVPRPASGRALARLRPQASRFPGSPEGKPKHEWVGEVGKRRNPGDLWMQLCSRPLFRLKVHIHCFVIEPQLLSGDTPRSFHSNRPGPTPSEGFPGPRAPCCVSCDSPQLTGHGWTPHPRAANGLRGSLVDPLPPRT